MYGTKVVTGKIIEIRDDTVVTLHGDTVSTYHLRYYKMISEEPLLLMESECAELEVELTSDTAVHSSGWFQSEWKPLVSRLSALMKRVNRA